MARPSSAQGAFEYYVGLGEGRSYRSVAAHFGISKRSVAERARTENWQERLALLLHEAGAEANRKSGRDAASASAPRAKRTDELQQAFGEVVTPLRFKAIVASLVKAAVQKEDVGAAKFLVERALGKVRSEALSTTALDIPDGLETTADVRRAANALLQGVTDGSVSPEDAQRTAVVVEAARKSIETDVLDKRIAAIEENLKKEKDG